MRLINLLLKLPPIASVHLATLLFGIAGVVGAAIGLSAIEVTFGRTLFASVALGAVWLFISTTGRTGQPPNSNQSQNKPIISLLSLGSGVLLAFHWVAFFASIQSSTVAIGLVTFSTCPVFVSMLEPLYFRERFKPSSVAASIVVLLGVFIVSGVFRGEVVHAKGIAYGIASGFSFAILQLVNRKLAKTSGPLLTSLTQNIVATTLLLPIVAGGLGAIQSSQWGALIFLGVGCTALAHTLFIYALKQVKVATASLITAGLEPLYGIALAAIFLAQWPGANVLIGGAIILLAVGVMTHGKEAEGEVANNEER